MTRHSRFGFIFEILFFLISAGRIRTAAAGKQHDVISRCSCSLGNLIECRLQSTPIVEVQFSLYNSLTKILPNIKWGNVAPLTFITGFFPTITSDQLSISLLLFPSVAQAAFFNLEIDLYLGLNAHVGDISSAITLCVAYVLHSGGKITPLIKVH